MLTLVQRVSPINQSYKFASYTVDTPKQQVVCKWRENGGSCFIACFSSHTITSKASSNIFQDYYVWRNFSPIFDFQLTFYWLFWDQTHRLSRSQFLPQKSALQTLVCNFLMQLWYLDLIFSNNYFAFTWLIFEVKDTSTCLHSEI